MQVEVRLVASAIQASCSPTESQGGVHRASSFVTVTLTFRTVPTPLVNGAMGYHAGMGIKRLEIDGPQIIREDEARLQPVSRSGPIDGIANAQTAEKRLAAVVIAGPRWDALDMNRAAHALSCDGYFSLS